MADLPEGVRGEVVAAILTPLSDVEWREALWNATESEREFAGRLAGQLADMRGRQATAILWLVELLAPYMRHDLDKPLMDVIADAPEDVRARALRYLDMFDT